MNKGHRLFILQKKYDELHTLNQEGEQDDSLREVPPQCHEIIKQM
jgi:hypothetical protein